MLRIDRKQLIYVIVVVINIILVFSCNRLDAGETNLIVKSKERDSSEELIKEQYKDYNLLMISINNVGAEHMSLYGYKRRTTPNLDKWAGDAIVFENAFSHASWTLPVATSVFTSLYPYTHKVLHRFRTNLLDKNIKTLPEILRENNYRTAAFTGGLDYIKEFGHMRGFDDTDDNPNFTGFDTSLAQAKNWLSQNSDKKFFLFIHGYTAHAPFSPPENFKGIFSNPEGKNITVDHRICLRGYRNSDNEYVAHYLSQRDPFAGTQPTRIKKPTIIMPKKKKVILTQGDIDYLRDLYDEEILYVDSMIGDFLSSLDKKLLDKTIIIIFSEHGEMFAKHGRFGRAGATRGTLYDEVVHVPLIIKIPEGQAKRRKELVQIIDIMPTALDMLDIPLSQKIQGKSLIPLIDDDRPVNEYVYAGSEFNISRPRSSAFYNIQSINESIRDYRWKLIREVKFLVSNINEGEQMQEETFELYDLQNDPDELANLADEHPNITKDLKEKLSEWAKCSKVFIPFRPSTKEVPEELLQDAIKHGYW